MFGSGADINDINNALTKGDVEINEDLATTGTLKVGAGNTLTISATQTQSITVDTQTNADAKVILKDDANITLSGSGKVKVGNNAEVTIADYNANKSAMAGAKSALQTATSSLASNSKTSPATKTTDEISAAATQFANLFTFAATGTNVTVEIDKEVTGHDVGDGVLTEAKYDSNNVQVKLKDGYATTDGNGKKVGLAVTLSASGVTSETYYVLVTLTDAT